MTEALDADAIVRLLGLKPHPEGGFYRETFRDPATDAAGRSRSTCIYFLLKAGWSSHWHRVDAVETWHHYAGAAVELSLSADGVDVERLRLGPDLSAGERPQGVVPHGAWQAARSLGDWSLVGCTVAPAFDFAGFELAPPDWSPTGG
ncbi:cupin domain-containing protein [Methylopila musalis]|uniref:Cupin domain-containing protein n=1 Tax=Methylopila musalis TaxID=1134781 RepID=A0ABW3Z4G6_9HYPH